MKKHLKEALESVPTSFPLVALLVFLILWWLASWWLALILVVATILIDLLVLQAGFNYIREKINSRYNKRRRA